MKMIIEPLKCHLIRVMNVSEIRSVCLACTMSNLHHLIIPVISYKCGSQAGKSSGV